MFGTGLLIVNLHKYKELMSGILKPNIQKLLRWAAFYNSPNERSCVFIKELPSESCGRWNWFLVALNSLKANIWKTKSTRQQWIIIWTMNALQHLFEKVLKFRTINKSDNWLIRGEMWFVHYLLVYRLPTVSST